MNVLVTGAGGMLARAVLSELSDRGHSVVPLDRAALDVTDGSAVEAAVMEARPDAVVQCAAYTRVDDAETEEAQALAVNAHSTAHVARACRLAGARLVYPSTDYVFDGAASEPIPPDAPTSPINAYGRTKLAGERAAAEADALVVRTSWLYGAGGRHFVGTMVDLARAGRPLRVVTDQRGAPTWTGSLAAMIATLLERRAPAGVYHATNAGDATWLELARAALELAGVEADIGPATSAEFVRPAARPAWSVLDCTRTYALTGPAPHWRDALAAFMDREL